MCWSKATNGRMWRPAIDPDAYWAAGLRTRQLAGRGEKAVIEPSSLQRRNSQLKEIARLRADGALTESEFEAVKARLLSDEASAYRKKLVRRPQWTTRSRLRRRRPRARVPSGASVRAEPITRANF